MLIAIISSIWIGIGFPFAALVGKSISLADKLDRVEPDCYNR